MASTKPRVKPEEIRLVKGDQSKIVRSREDLVQAKFDGWQVDKAGAKSVVTQTAGGQTADGKSEK